MNTNIIIKGVECLLNENGVVELNLEHVARGLGFTQIAKSGNEVVRWETVRTYLQEYNVIPRSWDGIGSNGLPEFIPENIFYKLVLKAKNETAKGFQDLVTDEILPSIRKHGGYLTPSKTEELLMNPDLIIQMATSLKDERSKRAALETKVAEQAPKVLFADAVATSERSVLVSELAKILKQNGIEIGQNRMFVWLRSNGYLCIKGEMYNQPTQRAMELGLFEVKKQTIGKPDGTVLTTATTKVTGKGQIYFVNKFLRKEVA